MDTSTALEASSSSSPSSASASTTTTTSSSSSSSPFDVFLSFSGEDTRKTFTDHLYWTMKDAGIDFFMEENESIRRGENISDKVKQIIEGSRVSVIVFSSRYADSIWCLEELVQIMECRRTLKQMVLPIFYDPSPSDVMGTFVQAFQKHRERFHEDTDIQEKIRRWTDALTEAAGLTVRVFRTTNGYEGMFIREIIDEITRQLKSPTPVGIAFSELQRLHSPKLEDIDSTEHTDTASSVSRLKKRCHEPDHSDSTLSKFPKRSEGRLTVMLPGGIDRPPDDGFSWRKYGQKDLLGSSHPRSYYRCTYRNTKGCWATKQVNCDPNDPAMLIVTYVGVHTCTPENMGNEHAPDNMGNFHADTTTIRVPADIQPDEYSWCTPENMGNEHAPDNMGNFHADTTTIRVPADIQPDEYSWCTPENMGNEHSPENDRRKEMAYQQFLMENWPSSAQFSEYIQEATPMESKKPSWEKLLH